MLFSSRVLGLIAATATSVAAVAIDRTYIIQLSQESNTLLGRSADQHDLFHKRASSLQYTVRQKFINPDLYLGLSIQVTSPGSDDEIRSQLLAIPGVTSVASVHTVAVPNITTQDTSSFSPHPPQLSSPKPGKGANLASALQMGGVDKLHNLGIKGAGIRIGIVDTGVDYRHPALGGGFGKGHKIAGGYSFITDNGTLAESPDPLITCNGGGHGTHVTGIVGMDSVKGGFDVVGVAPEAEIYMYRVLDCDASGGGSDVVMAALAKAYEDKVDLVSMSLGFGIPPISGAPDPIASIVAKLHDAGIAVIVAVANDATWSNAAAELYEAEWPSSDPNAIGVGAVSNTQFPLVYSAQDSFSKTLHYASNYPLNISTLASVYIVEDPCFGNNWEDALANLNGTSINETVFAFQVDSSCTALDAGSTGISAIHPPYILAFNANTTNPYLAEYDVPSPGYFNSNFGYLNFQDGLTLTQNFAKAGGFPKYKLNFYKNTEFTSNAQASGGMIAYYSDFGPVRFTYDLKPEISAPGGHILSTWPLGQYGGYCVLQGTSMATPYLAASYALVKSKFPKESITQLLNRLQTTAAAMPWALNTTMLSAVAQQGAGLVNVYNAIFSQSIISPGQIILGDQSRTVYGAANITIKNPSILPKTYSFSHQGAGYMDYTLQFRELNQIPLYATADFPTKTVVVLPGQSKTVHFTIVPPQGVVPTNLPVAGGFISVASSDGEKFHVPYIGPPYSLYNQPYLQISTTGTILPQVQVRNTDGTVTVDRGLAEFVEGQGFGSVFGVFQQSTEFRIDVLPANTTITATYYGFNTSETFPYVPSVSTPEESIFGHPSFGTIINATGLLWPTGYRPTGQDSTVKRSDGTSYKTGPGDYRWYVSILKWGGVSGKQEDYESWLGPIMRWVPAS
ncbi:peptidase S8/S53 domain-containing protein [Xylogone sp. PMI_703]|nr:peptidase S8/S53 domain-containing protein [Xylogone sp. PMI_703]